MKTLAGSPVFIGPESDSNCDFNNIQDAIDSGATDMYISNAKQYNENLVLPDTDSRVDIRGGYTSCSIDSFDSALKSTVSGHLEELPVLIIFPSTEFKEIAIRNMNLLLGTGAGFFPAGGINMPGSNDRLVLDNTTVGLNEGTLGGGIYIGTQPETPINERPNLVITSNSLIVNNLSNSVTYGGGGVFCETGRIVITENASIKRNRTDGSGGGFYLNDCSLIDWSGNKIGENEPEKGIFENQAKSHGGGVYGTNTSSIQLGSATGSLLYGSILNNISDSDNDSIGDGGGVHFTDSEIYVSGSIIAGNRSGGDGGAIYAQGDGTIRLNKHINRCWNDYKCNQITDNQASNGDGGGLYLIDGYKMRIDSAYFENNRADNGTAIYLANGYSLNHIKNAIFFNNGANGSDGFSDNNVVMVNSESSISSIHNTFFNNGETVSTFRSQNDSNLTIEGNIIYSGTASSAVRTANSSPASINCANTNMLPLAGTDVISTPISFIDEASGNFRLAGDDTGAMDACPNFGLTVDAEGDERPYDNPQRVNLSGAFDIGADEYADLIFKNSFE